MKKIVSLMFAMGAVCAASLTSCSSNDSLDAEYIPVKESRSGNWSFYAPNGDIVCQDEFKNIPSPVINGYFYAEESNGSYTLYKMGDKPEAVTDCDGLVDVGFMYNGIVPIVKMDARISYVNSNGEVKFTIEPIGGKEVVYAQSYASEGMIAVATEDRKWGYLNSNGEVVIAPKYGYASPFNNGLAMVRLDGIISAIDKQGEVVFKLKEGYNSYNTFKNGYLLANDPNGKLVLVNEKGEVAYKFKEGIYKIYDYNKEYAIYRNGDGVGVMTLDGEVIIKPGKYHNISFITDNTFIADKDSKSVIINTEGEVTTTFDETVRYDKNFGYYTIESTTCTFIDEDGKEKKNASFFRLGDFSADKELVRSNYKGNY